MARFLYQRFHSCYKLFIFYHPWSQTSYGVFVLAVGGQGVFREFLKSEFSEENIEFWLACEDYKKTKSDHLHGKAERIYEEFVQSDAIKQVSVNLICINLP